MPRLSLKELGEIFIISFQEFKRNEPLRLAGATAFFTTFALPPILIILVRVIGLVFTINNLRYQFFIHLSEMLGPQSAAQIRITILGFISLANNWVFAIVGFIFLMFVATTLFKVIKDSLNQLWNVRPAGKQTFRLQLQSRLISLVVILFAGLLFLGGMVAEGIEVYLHQHSGTLHPHTANFLTTLLNNLFSVVIVATWFSILFKVLPDAKTTWKVVFAGGLFTGILFSIGRVVIRSALSRGNLTNIFGASSSIVLLLLFVFYSAFILYYGACFTKVFATYIKEPIKAAAHAIQYKMVEVKSHE